MTNQFHTYIYPSLDRTGAVLTVIAYRGGEEPEAIKDASFDDLSRLPRIPPRRAGSAR
jgi:hypothetical protein